MHVLGHQLRELQTGYFHRHVNGVDLWAYQMGKRWHVRVELVDSSIVVCADSATLDAAADKVRTRIVDHLPSFAAALFGKREAA